MTAPHADLPRNVAAFARLLRERHGFRLGPGEVEVALLALQVLNVSDLEEVRDGLRMVLTARSEQAAPFDRAFDAFFLPQGRPGVPQANLPALPQPPGPNPPPSDKQERETPSPRPPEQPDPDPQELRGPGGQQRQSEDQDGPEAPDGAPILRAQFSPEAGGDGSARLTPEGLNDLLHSAGALLRQLRLGRSRKWRPMPRGRRFDFRRTLRASLRHGGEPADLHVQGHPRRNPRVLLVLDASRSMAGHAGLLLRYAYALGLRSRRVEVFAFSTGLTRLSPTLRRLVPGAAGTDLPPLGEAWGGGTRIGENLNKLLREHPQTLTPDTVVIILSDGLDVGEPEPLALAVRELRRRSGLLVWLNPLLSTPGYQPTARGMAAALPHLDVFASGADTSALAELPGKLRLRR